jgi:hypothetical protein
VATYTSTQIVWVEGGSGIANAGDGATVALFAVPGIGYLLKKTPGRGAGCDQRPGSLRPQS